MLFINSNLRVNSYIIDDTIIGKMYSKYIAGSSDNYDPVTGKTFRSICSVVAMISNGKLALPIAHALWVKEELCSEGDYRTKVEVAQQLIEQLREKLSIKVVLRDGLYNTSSMIAWRNRKKVSCEMCFSNKRISLDQESLDLTVEINECKKLKLTGKNSCRIVKAIGQQEDV
ncbi:transposase [Candidatus Dependentiae bacterium]|nr:transposase [Candidatus Dependentiae bacterium]